MINSNDINRGHEEEEVIKVRSRSPPVMNRKANRKEVALII